MESDGAGPGAGSAGGARGIDVAAIRALGDKLRAEVGKAILGQDDAIEQVIVGLLASGHVLLEGVPGTGKTLLTKALVRALGGDFRRIQFTPDLMPSDVLGTKVWDDARKEFHLRRGPIFADVVLGDEINRAPPKTQAAFLEAMEERQVTVDGERLSLPDGFFVIATRNPVEYEGTYPLPEAQLDRFLLMVRMGYPDEATEMRLLGGGNPAGGSHDLEALGVTRVTSPAELNHARRSLGGILATEETIAYLVRMARLTRESPDVALGASPRAALGWLAAARALAALRGSPHVTPDDVKECARPVLRHRIVLQPEAEMAGADPDAVIEAVMGRVEVPR
jgi:MoxR-like ATPase